MICDVSLFQGGDLDGSGGLETTLESLLAPGRGYDMTGGGASAEWEVEDDPDLANEPLLQLDMQVRKLVM